MTGTKATQIASLSLKTPFAHHHPSSSTPTTPFLRLPPSTPSSIESYPNDPLAPCEASRCHWVLAHSSMSCSPPKHEIYPPRLYRNTSFYLPLFLHGQSRPYRWTSSLPLLLFVNGTGGRRPYHCHCSRGASTPPHLEGPDSFLLS